jgi:hypothetical protein
MVIPNDREKELQRFKDPLFVASFRENNWKYITYSSISRLAGFSQPTLEELLRISKEL